MRGRRHDTDTLSSEAVPRRCDRELLRQLDEQLHAMSQPMTVLLCAMEYSAGLESVQEVNEMLSASRQACERLRCGIGAMQAVLRRAIEERAGDMPEPDEAKRGDEVCAD